jgi:inner membrane protein
MDTLTQFALGAGVGVAVLGRGMAPRKAAMIGGVLGVAPDLDVLYPFDDPIDAFVLHRTVSHSLVVQAVAAPIFGEALVRLFKELRDRRLATYLAVYLVFATHALLDAMTIYGTRLLWPLWPEAVGAGSIFIIDPIYTLPLLVAMIWALCLRSWTARLRRILTTGLALSTAYLVWGLAAQQVAYARAAQALGESGVEPDRMLAIPTPFNTLYWKVIALDGDRYLNLYLPVFGSVEQVAVHAHPRGAGLAGCLDGQDAFEKLASFSGGFYRIGQRGDRLVVSDLRMGLTPNYVFSFAVAERSGDMLRSIPPVRQRSERRAPGDLAWLFANLSGDFVVRPAEARAAVEVATLSPLPRDEQNRASC